MQFVFSFWSASSHFLVNRGTLLRFSLGEGSISVPFLVGTLEGRLCHSSFVDIGNCYWGEIDAGRKFLHNKNISPKS